MNSRPLILSAVLLLVARGGLAWGQAPPAAPAAEATASREEICAVCGPREKAGPEPVAATLVYEGKTYFFCKPDCLEEFRRDPGKWIRAAARLAARPPSGNPTAVPT